MWYLNIFDLGVSMEPTLSITVMASVSILKNVNII